jgi:hypothetical protein
MDRATVESEPVTTPLIAGVECTEEEPDDNFRPAAARVSADSKKEVGQAKEAQETPVEEASAELEPVEVLEEQEVLVGNWQQLEGLPRPPKSGELPRFLAWGPHGHVAVFPEQRRIEVQLPGEDAPRRIGDFAGLEMASLSGDACCLAAGAQAEGGSRLLIRPHERWDKAVFSAALGGGGEAVEAIACGDGFVAALTSKRLLRVYATSALPLGVISMPGRSVALAARGPLLLAVTETGPRAETDVDMALDYRLLDVRTRSERSSGRLPLSPCARLRWLGISAELAPVAVDTFGQVRVLLGTGAGSWGPVGGGAEWVPMLSLAEEESKVGPLWAVHAAKGILYCAELGQESSAPEPGQPVPVMPDEGGLSMPSYGHGYSLREFRWHLPVGPVSGVGSAAEEALREQLLAHHAGVTASAGLLPAGEATAAAVAQSKSWKSRAFSLFGQFVKAGELERALDVARSSLAIGEGGSRLLTFAQDFVEKAGHYKLADEIAKVPRILHAGDPAQAAVSASVPTIAVEPKVAATPTALPQAVPKVLNRELPPLFEPGEGADSTLKAASQEAVQEHGGNSPGIDSKPAAQPVADEVATFLATAPSPSALFAEQPSSKQPPEVARTTSNPFARKRPTNNAPSQTPHLLRDALSGGVRRPATPLGTTTTESAAKVARTTQ